MFPSDLVKDVILASDIMGGGVHGWMSLWTEEPTDGGAHKWKSPWMEEPTDVRGLTDGVGVFGHRDTMQTPLLSPFLVARSQLNSQAAARPF